ncbi:hypothetical protein E3N88_19490 [Mikania micrantha]|uniref:F-box associated beta-propeller type 1 domain-containing protein n=1 Tax=Mikania micrantha TaxID=192012 RepID=A0A5N6NNU6_9ASTR|nr:hypothetical protein E3N88_19490 [Mikania micrantha]
MEDSDHQSTQSGALIGSNNDLLTEILLRLPVTSILRFKSVSKHWQWILIVQSCKGLLLCHIDRCSIGARKYYVYNPTTKQLSFIPSIPGGENVHETIRFMGLAFHQTDCVHYKVVCIRCIKPDDVEFQIQIYSSDTRKWNISVESFSAHRPLLCKGVYSLLEWCCSLVAHSSQSLVLQNRG